MADQINNRNAGNGTSQNDAGNDGAGKFANVTKPEIDSAEPVAANGFTLGDLFHNRSRKPRSAYAGQ